MAVIKHQLASLVDGQVALARNLRQYNNLLFNAHTQLFCGGLQPLVELPRYPLIIKFKTDQTGLRIALQYPGHEQVGFGI